MTELPASRFARANLLLVLALITSGCSTYASVRSLSPVLSNQVVSERNFAEGQRTRAFVGDPVVKVRNYTVSLQPLGYATPNRAFNIPWGTLFGGLDVPAGGRYQIGGMTTLDGRDYFVVLVPSGMGQSIALLVTADGVIYPKILNMGATSGLGWALTGVSGYTVKGQIIDLKFNARDARMIPEVTKRFLPVEEGGAAYVNMELLYLGVTADALRLSYREFTQDDLARPAFSQELTYERGAKNIRFRVYELQVHEANADHIDFTVLPSTARSAQ